MSITHEPNRIRTPSDLNVEEIEQVRLAIEQGEGYRDIAAELGVKRHSLITWSRLQIRGGGWDKAKEKAAATTSQIIGNLSELRIVGTASAPVEFTDEAADIQAKHDKQIAGQKAQTVRYQKLYRAAIKGRAFEEEILGNLATSIQALQVMPPQPITVPKGRRASGLHASMAHLSDLHNGETVNLEVMGGLGEYDMGIFRQELGYYVKTFLRLLELKRSQLEIPTLHVMAGGDWISGLIHDELLKTNQVNVLDQTVTTAYWTAHAIAQISVHFEEVYFHGVVGNHGRTQQKVEFKDSYVNWDYICYQMVANYLKDYTHIKFDIPKSLWQVVDVVGTKWLHAHGHGIRSHMGIPYYGIDRFLREMRESLAIGDIQYDSVALCHFHQPSARWIPTGQLVINGTWKRGCEFAMGALHKIIDPIQIVSTVHEKYGPLAPEPIYLKWAEKEDADIIPERAPDVWADGTIPVDRY